MPQLRLSGLRSAPLIVIALSAPAYGASLPIEPARPIPWAIDRFVGFHGRIDYAGHRLDAAGSPEVTGRAVIGAGGFTLDERGARYELHADESGVVVRAGSVAARTSEVLDADPLLNAWAVTVAALAQGAAQPRGPNAWLTRTGPLVFTDQRGGTIVGVLAGSGRRSVAFTFSEWGVAAGIPFPTRIVRLRNGVTDARFAIDRFAISPLFPDVNAAAPLTARDARERGGRVQADQLAFASESRTVPLFPWRLVTTAFGLMLLAVAIVAWLRRDAFTNSSCARLADDPRAWRHSALPAYVSSDGMLLFEGNEYRVGPNFYARSVEVEHSALFLRVTAPGVSHGVVFPRRLPRLAAPVRPRRRAATGGMSLIESMVAMAFFAIVVVAAIYPALAAVARADYVAAQKRAALVAVANALTDEVEACEYGSATPTGSTSTLVDGFTVSVTVSDSSIAGARDIQVSATDATGLVLARLATTVGPPVPVPGSTSAPLPPTSPPATPTPPPQASPTPTPPSGPPGHGAGSG